MNLYDKEIEELQEAKKAFSEGAHGDSEILERYKKLLALCEKTIKTMIEITTISDSQQRYLLKLQEKLELEASTDNMTGIFNRSTGLAMLQRELSAMSRSLLPLSICYFDIDNMKAVNDKYGHEEGDNMIKTIVELVKGNIRDADVFCRMGGDEFLIVMPNCTDVQAHKITDRIYASLRYYKDKDYKLSLSAVIHEIKPDENHSIDSLLDISAKKMNEQKLQLRPGRLRTFTL